MPTRIDTTEHKSISAKILIDFIAAADTGKIAPTYSSIKSNYPGHGASYYISCIKYLEDKGEIKIHYDSGCIEIVRTGKKTKPRLFVNHTVKKAPKIEWEPLLGDVGHQVRLAKAGGFKDHPRAKPPQSFRNPLIPRTDTLICEGPRNKGRS